MEKSGPSEVDPDAFCYNSEIQIDWVPATPASWLLAFGTAYPQMPNSLRYMSFFVSLAFVMNSNNNPRTMNILAKQ